MKSAPSLNLIYDWVDGLREGASQLIKEDRGNHQSGGMSKSVAFQVQAAVVASLVTGRETPPCRLSIIKTLLHPCCVDEWECQDQDCNNKGCKGNRVEVVACGAVGGDETVRIIAPHHKTEDSLQGQGPLDVTLPQGSLSSLMLAWVKSGWFCLDGKRKDPNLFTSTYGLAFTDSTFCQYWKRLMQSAPPNLPYFPPNLARTSFVEEWTGSRYWSIRL